MNFSMILIVQKILRFNNGSQVYSTPIWRVALTSVIQTKDSIKDSFHWLCYRPNKYGQCKKPKGLYVVKISPVMAKLIDTMLQPKYDQCKINPDQNTRNKMALLMERKYTKAMTEKCRLCKRCLFYKKIYPKD